MERVRATTQLALSSPLSILPTHHKDDIASDSFSLESGSRDVQEHICSRTCQCGSLDLEGSRTPKSQANRSLKLFPDIGQVFQRIRRLSTTAQSPRFVLRPSTRMVGLTLTSGTLILP